MATTTGTGRGAVTDAHTGWTCPNGASLLASITGPGRGTLPAHHGVIYVCPDHQAEAEARITAAGHQPDTDPAPLGHRWDPWPCGHITTYGDSGPQLAGTLTQALPRKDEPVTTTEPAATPDPLAYGPTGHPCGCGKTAHSNLTPCAADLRNQIGDALIAAGGVPDTLPILVNAQAGVLTDAVLGVLPPTPAPALAYAERQFLAFALDLAFDKMVSDDGFTDADNAAYDALRRLESADRTTPAQDSPLQHAEAAKHRRDLTGEINALMDGAAQMEAAPWYPSRPGDVVHIAYGAVGPFAAYGETYVIEAAPVEPFLNMRLLNHSPDLAEELQAMAGAYAVDETDEPLSEPWFEAGPARITVVRAGAVIPNGVSR